MYQLWLKNATMVVYGILFGGMHPIDTLLSLSNGSVLSNWENNT